MYKVLIGCEAHTAFHRRRISVNLLLHVSIIQLRFTGDSESITTRALVKANVTVAPDYSSSLYFTTEMSADGHQHPGGFERRPARSLYRTFLIHS